MEKCPVDHHKNKDGCPVDHSGTSASPWSAINERNMMPAPNQKPAPGQRVPLDKSRVRSSIPKGDYNPKHQEGAVGDGKWTYPSEQMFFNAMKRKGYNPNEEDMPTVVAIHNAVNERSWREVLVYEGFGIDAEISEDETLPTLVRFKGRPGDLSPKARLMSMVGYSKPFDRHDWIVRRTNGEERRYVIDYYRAESIPGRPPAFHIDARPALDSFSAAFDRAKIAARDFFS